MPHPPSITKTCPTCRQTKPEDQFRRVGTNTAVKNCLACRDRYRPGRKRLSEEFVVVSHGTLLPTNSNTSNIFYQHIVPRPTQPVPHGGEQEHGAQNVFRVEPPKRKKVNRKKKDHREEEPQLMEIGSMVLGPMGPSFALLPSLQSNSRSRERRGAESREQRVRTVDLTGPEPQSRGANSRPLPLRPQEHSSGSREQRVRTVISTELQSRDSSSLSMPPRPQIEHSAERERQVRTIDSTEPEPQPRDASSRTPAPRPPTNDGDLEKYVSRCWDAGCTSCRSYSLRP